MAPKGLKGLHAPLVSEADLKRAQELLKQDAEKKRQQSSIR